MTSKLDTYVPLPYIFSPEISLYSEIYSFAPRKKSYDEKRLTSEKENK